VLEASQEKADAFFGGHRFWQVPGTSMHDDGEATVDLPRRICAASAVHHRVPGTEG
jgi:hypothetical protein